MMVLIGTLTLPGDKSIAHRSLLVSLLGEGSYRVRGFPDSLDCRSTLQAVRSLGVEVEREANGVLHVSSPGPDRLLSPEEPIDAGNSGTTTRLLCGLLAGLPVHARIIGDASLSRRPMRRVIEPLRAMGASLRGEVSDDRLPIRVSGTRLRGTTHTLPVASAQVKSALLFAGSRASGTTRMIEPALSRDHTERMLRSLGIPVRQLPDLRSGHGLEVCGEHSPTLCDLNIPGDLSSAAFFLAAACMVADSDVTLCGVGLNPTRTGLLTVLRMMGADVAVPAEPASDNQEPWGEVRVRGTRALQAVEVGGDMIPRLLDELPILAVLATQAHGTTVIREAAELRVKESDRLAATANALSALGASITEREDGLVIDGPVNLEGGEVDAQGDHRIAMAMQIASLVARGPVKIRDRECVAVSYPGFFRDLDSLCAAPPN